MLGKLSLALLILPLSAFAEISGPDTDEDGYFTLTWNGKGTLLQEVDTNTGTVLKFWTGGSVDLSRETGRYTFNEVLCVPVPFVGLRCVSQDSHVVVVGRGDSGAITPDSLDDQAQYTFTTKSGDFDSDGRVDVLVDRTSDGDVDGSMQSYVLYQREGGRVEAVKPTEAELKKARGFQSTNRLNLIPNDFNVDGFADHMIENLQSVMGSTVVDEHLVFAPGTATDKTKPSGDIAVTHAITSFYADLGKWMNDSTHFAKNISATTTPVYAVGWSCTPVWSDPIAGFFPVSLCQPYIRFVGLNVKLEGVNLSALAAASRIEPFLSGSERPSVLDLWNLSRIARSVLGVHLFGFNDNGELGDYNFDISEEVDELRALLVHYLHELMRIGKDMHENKQAESGTHDYSVETEICTVTEETKAWCTLANIACWGRHYPAPYLDESDHQKAVKNDAESKLGNCLIIGGEKSCVSWMGPNPIKTAVGTEGGLPENAIANTTLPGHLFHDPNNPKVCPKKLNEGDWKTSPPNKCSQVYREPHLQDGKITMRTRGYGSGANAEINQAQGPLIFADLDQSMVEAMNSKSDKLCPAGSKSE